MQEHGERRFLTVDEVARVTGLSASTIRRRVRDGSITAVQPGGRRKRLLFDAESLGGLALSESPQAAPDSCRTTTPKQRVASIPPWRNQ